MNIKNTKLLLKKHPKIFKQHSLPPTETAMCWLFECGDGWYNIINILCKQLQWDIDNNREPQIEAIHIKEKYGILSFYVSPSSDRQSGMINLTETFSKHICEECGSDEDVSQTQGWIVTRCKKCHKKRKKDEAKKADNIFRND